jgi:hypothetical protein
MPDKLSSVNFIHRVRPSRASAGASVYVMSGHRLRNALTQKLAKRTTSRWLAATRATDLLQVTVVKARTKAYTCAQLRRESHTKSEGIHVLHTALHRSVHLW